MRTAGEGQTGWGAEPCNGMPRRSGAPAARWYFAYGLNMSRAAMATRCPTATSHGTALLDGYAFQVNSCGVATLVRADSSKVWGLLWQLRPADEDTLDRFEGVAEHFYRKAVVRPRAGGRRVPSLIYLAADSSSGRPRAGYMEAVVAAARENDFPQTYIRTLMHWATAHR